MNINLQLSNSSNVDHTVENKIPNVSLLSKIENVSNSCNETKINEFIRARCQGAKVRLDIKVFTKSRIINVQIRKITNLEIPQDAPIGIIRRNMSSDATYKSLLIRGGTENLDTVSILDGQLPKSASKLLSGRGDLPHNGAVANGGYYVHREGLFSADNKNCLIGYTVGETKGKSNVVPIPEPWKDVYGTVKNNNGEVLLCSAPVLEKNASFEGDRFKYRVIDKSQKSNGELVLNPLNILAGALGHSSEPNERAAISVGEKDVKLRTLTTKNGKRETGMDMKSWNETVTSTGEQMYHLNLDGAGSVYMGIISENGNEIETIAKGGGSGDNDRPLANILITYPSD